MTYSRSELYSHGSQGNIYIFEPQENMTAYNLAQLLPLLISAWKDSGGNINQIMQSREIPASLTAIVDSLPSDLSIYFRKKN